MGIKLNIDSEGNVLGAMHQRPNCLHNLPCKYLSVTPLDNVPEYLEGKAVNMNCMIDGQNVFHHADKGICPKNLWWKMP